MSNVAKDWVVFDDVNLPERQSVPLSQPPNIPQRKGLVSTNGVLKSGNVLTANGNQLQSAKTSSVPPIPERVLSPRKAATPVPSASTNTDIRLPPPPMSANSSLKRQSRSRSCVSTPLRSVNPDKHVAVLGPPIPPRKDIVKRQAERDSVSDISRASDTSSLQGWIKFEYSGSSQGKLSRLLQCVVS